MLVPAPPEVDARQTLGFIAKHDQTSIWKTISAKTTLYLQKPCPDRLRSSSRRKQLKKELVAPAPGQRDPDGGCVECRNTSQSYKSRNSKGKLGAHPCLSLFRESSQWSDNSLTQGTVKGETNRSCLPEGKAGAEPEADGSLLLDNRSRTRSGQLTSVGQQEPNQKWTAHFCWTTGAEPEADGSLLLDNRSRTRSGRLTSVGQQELN